MVLLQPNVKSLKIAAAVNDVNNKLVIGEVVKQFNLGGSCRSGEEVKTSRNIEFIADFRLPEEMRRIGDVNKKLVIGEVVKQFNLGGSC